MTSALEDTRRLEATAATAVQTGDLGAASAVFRSLLTELHHPDRVYDGWVESLADAAEAAGRPALAAVAREYLLDPLGAHEAWRRAERPADAARCLLRAGQAAEAAEAFAAVGAFARAAAAWERAGDDGRARQAWGRAAQGFEAAGDAYLTALALLNEALAGADGEGAHVDDGRLSRAIVLLEEEADRAETAGEGRRALSCYHALIHVGRKTGTHENLAEGFLNCIRYMRDRDHRFLALQYFHDFAEASLEMGEAQAAAEVLREASAYCRRTGLLYADAFLARAADAFDATAEGHLGLGAADLAESALLAALDCHNRRGDAAAVKATYGRLAALPLAEARRARYARLAERAPGGPSRPATWPFQGYFADDTAYPETWRTDATDADAAGDPLSPVPEAVGDVGYWDVVRRRCLLICLERAASDGDDPARRQARVAELGRLGAPLALPPLVRAFADPDPALRAAVARSLRFLPFRGSLELVDRAVADPVPEVRDAAVAALRYLAFPGAFGPLVRLYRDHTDLPVRREALLALGRLVGMDRTAPSRDALDFLLHTLREGVDPALAEDLSVAISANVSESGLPVLERHLAAEPPGPAHRFLERVATRVETRRVARTLGEGAWRT